MAHCANCNRVLEQGDEYGLVRVQLWKTKVGSTECKQPDSEDTRTYCLPCVGSARILIEKV